MKISNRLYQSLGPQDRALAIFAALGRGDQAEMDRLMRGSVDNAAVRKAILGLILALRSYNMLIDRAMIGFLNADRKREKIDSFCMGWRAAGGPAESEAFKQLELIVQMLSSVCDQWTAEIDDTLLVAQEWCTANKIPFTFFSELLCPLPLPEESLEVTDSKNYQELRAAFEKMTLY